MHQLGGLTVLAAPAVAFIVTLIVTKRVAQTIYNKTGYNGFASLHKVLCALITLLPLALAFAGIGSSGPSLKAFAPALIPIAILIVLNLKAKDPGAIIALTVLQVLYGIAWLLFMILKIVLNFFLHLNLQGLNIQLDELNAITQEQVARQQAAAQTAKRKKNETADAYAQRLGFRNADDAERAGIDTGKYRE